MRTTKADFEYFKERANSWAKELGLISWELFFEHGTHSTLAWAEPDFHGHCVTIGLGANWSSVKITREAIDVAAKHEMLHVLLCPLYSYARERFVNSQQIENVEEEIVSLLEKVVK